MGTASEEACLRRQLDGQALRQGPTRLAKISRACRLKPNHKPPRERR